MSMDSVIDAAMTAYYEHIKSRFPGMPIGYILCVHRELEPVGTEANKVRIKIESHFILNIDDCKVKHAEKIGPKIRELEDVDLRPEPTTT